MSATTSGPRLCTEWIFSNNSNVHIAKDREWFVEYRPFKTFTTSYISALSADIAGIGVVEVPVKRSPNRSGAKAHGKLRLENVLHAPDAICNILGGLAIDDSYRVLLAPGGMSDGTNGGIENLQGRRVAYFYTPPNGRRLCQLKLSGPPIGPLSAPSCFENDRVYMINATWPAEERQRWLRSQVRASGELQAPPSVPMNPAGSQQQTNKPSHAVGKEGTDIITLEPYTAEEKEWLKKYCGGELKLLQRYGLSIYKDEDREQGRAIVRALIRQDDEEEEEDEDKEYDFMKSPEGHMADYHFSDSELDFIQKNWGDSATFMFTYGLKFYGDDDCEEAKVIVSALMSNSDDEEDFDDAFDSDGAGQVKIPVT